VILLSLVALSAHTPAGTPFRIERLDSALDEVIDLDARLQTLGGRFLPDDVRTRIAGIRPGQLRR
jgi:hypothetical protein